MEHTSIRLPREARSYILYQRTKLDLQTKFGKFSAGITRLFPFLYHPFVLLRTFVHGDWIDRRFNQVIDADYETIRPHLPNLPAPTIIDIGCGIAGIDVCLSTHYSHRARFVLVDRTQIDSKIHYGFEEYASFYNSLPLARQVLIDNGVAPENITLLSPEEFIKNPPLADIVISLESWGFHYPIASYLDAVKQSVKKGGTIITEVRKGSGEFGVLKDNCTSMELISDSKRQRILCTLASNLAE